MLTTVAVGRVKESKIVPSPKDATKTFGAITIEVQDGQYTTSVEVSVWGKFSADVSSLGPGDVIAVSGKTGSRGWEYQGKTYSRITINSSGFVVIQKAPAKPRI